MKSHRTEAEVSKKRVGNYQPRHLQSITQQFVDTVQTKTLVRALRPEGSQNHSSSDLHVILSVHLVKKHENQRPHCSRKLGSHSSQVGQSIQIDQAEWSHRSDNLKYKFSVIIDKGCHLKVAKMLLPMTKTTICIGNPVLDGN